MEIPNIIRVASDERLKRLQKMIIQRAGKQFCDKDLDRHTLSFSASKQKQKGPELVETFCVLGEGGFK